MDHKLLLEGKSQNFEWKACIKNGDELKEILITKFGEPKHLKQVDYFYYPVIDGLRKKVRVEKYIPFVHHERDKFEEKFMMIDYYRDDKKEARQSDFTIKNLTEEQFQKWKDNCQDIWMIVDKKRYLWILEYQNTKMRLHFDQIKGLKGTFVEFELTKSDQLTPDKSKEIIGYWIRQLELQNAEPVENAYADMLLNQRIENQQICGLVMIGVVCLLALIWLCFMNK